MKYIAAFATLLVAAMALPTTEGEKPNVDGSTPTQICTSKQTIVCQDNGNGGLLSLGNLLNGVLGKSCSGGSVYCCEGDVKQEGLINLNLDLSCTLNELL
ncbi:hypothetical protein N7495_009871 [Penicillium taxi]|uniref:uncharacterized protein n=1 Tax=Penicillium taxi TaxID=168475 RepID=UPI0025455461|nr:uncharacterized protein N7495_009871 [Penicillium taxi]KAJ5885361.1 hypothetical protein N7495_009871 [Penicillium taxi]